MFLWLIYVAGSVIILLVLMNIIIAVMGEVQGQRAEQGRATVYATQAKVIIEEFSRFKDKTEMRGQTNWPRYLTIAYRRTEEEEEKH